MSSDDAFDPAVDCPRCDIAVVGAQAHRLKSAGSSLQAAALLWLAGTLLALIIVGLWAPAAYATGVLPASIFGYLGARLRRAGERYLGRCQAMIRSAIAASPGRRISGIQHTHGIDKEIICDGCIADLLGDSSLAAHEHSF